MEELLPGLHHWTAYHERIKQPVSSYYVEPAATLLDPMLPEEGLAALEDLSTRPRRILLSNRHHLRHAHRFVEAYGCEVHANKAALHEFDEHAGVRPFDIGDEPAPGIRALAVGAICPDDTAFHIDLDGGALAFADGLITVEGRLSFVPDFLMGDGADAVKRGLTDSLERLLDERFDHILTAHGDPVVGGAHEELETFVREARATG